MHQVDTGIPEQEAEAPGKGLADTPARVALCGPLRVELSGRRVEDQLPGRQGRLVLAFLVVNRGRPVSRDELVDLLWPDNAPAAPESSLRPLLTRLRRALGDERLVGRAQLGLELGPGAWVDVEVAEQAAGRAEAALESGHHAGALRIATEALEIVERPFLPDVLSPWAEQRRTELGDLEAPLLEAAARAALALGGSHAAEAERLARRLVEREPYRESGHGLLMEILAAQGNVVEALRVFDGLRVRLRDELGVTPAASLTALHDRLLRQDAEPAAQPAPPAARGDAPRFTRREGPAARPELPPALVDASAGAFVGRRQELEQLDAAWQRAIAGSEQLAFIAGEPGVGKTRLVARFAERIHRQGATVLYGRCDEEVLIPYQPVVEALSHVVRDGRPLDLPAELAHELVRLVPEVTEDGAPAEAREPLLGERDTQRYRLFEAVATALGGLAGEHGLLLVMDDLHWADRTTLLLLRFLARIGGPARVLLLATYRDDEVATDHPLSDLLADVRRDRRFERIALQGLGEEDVAALVAARLAAGGAPDFVQRLQIQTSGNPFFIEETLRGLGETGDRLDVERLEESGVPEGVGDVIMRRLGSAGDDVRDVLAVAAVVGREFDLDVVAAAMGRSDEEVLSAVERAMAARLVDEVPGQVDRFSFCHALVRETLYDRQAVSRRLRRHLRVGEALERAPRRRRAPAAELARHFYEARALADPDTVLRHVLAAAAEASDTLAYEEAAGHLVRALELLDEAEEPDLARRTEALLSLGRALWRAGDPTARERFAEAAETARQAGLPEERAAAVLGMTGRFYEAGVADPATIGLVEGALEALDEGDSVLRARLLARLSDSLHVAADEDRRAAISADAVAMARRLGDPDTLTVALMARHAALLHASHLDERLRIAGEQLALARERRRTEMVALGLHWRIYDHLERGDGQAARRDDTELAAVAADLRQPLYRYLSRCWQAVWAQMEGRYDEADQLSADAYAIGRRAGARTAGSTRLATLVAVRRDEGRLGELAPQVRAIVAEHPWITSWRALLPLVLLDAGDPGGARDVLDELHAEGFGRIQRDLFWLTTMAVLGDAAADIGTDEQRAELYALLEPHAAHCVPASLAACWGSAERILGRLALALGRARDAAGHFERAIAAEERLAAPALVERSRRELARAIEAQA
jgi:DNA-binding SARP family transcriptional activator